MNLISFWKRVGLSNNSFFREVLSGKGPKFSACSWKVIVNRHKVIFFWKLPLQIWAIGAIVGSREGPGYPTFSINGYCKCNFRSWVTIVSAICSCDLSYYGGFENLSNFHKICSLGNTCDCFKFARSRFAAQFIPGSARGGDNVIIVIMCNVYLSMGLH